jgi:hypothetical protein
MLQRSLLDDRNRGIEDQMEPADADFIAALVLICRAVENDRQADAEGCRGLRRVAESYREQAEALIGRGLDYAE